MTKLQGIKCIFFDLGSTLSDETECWNDRIDKTVEMGNGKVTKDQFISYLIEESEKKIDNYSYALKKSNISYRAPWAYDKEVLYSGVKHLLNDLKAKGYTLGVIANQPIGTVDKLERLGIKSYFDIVCGSADVGLYKPSIEIYKYACKQLNLEPQQCVMVGDRLENDIAPPKSIGMKTIWIIQNFAKYQAADKEEYYPDFSYNHIWEIAELF